MGDRENQQHCNKTALEAGVTLDGQGILFVPEVGICGTETEKRQSQALAEAFWDREGIEGSKNHWGDGENSYFPGSLVLCFPQVLAHPGCRIWV